MSSDYIPILTSEDVIAAMRTLRMNQRVNFWAFYSSQLGGIVTDPALMVLPFDDHMVHRGHGVFDSLSAAGAGSGVDSPGACDVYAAGASDGAAFCSDV